MSKKARDYTLFLEDVLNATTPYYFGIDLEAVWDTIKNNLPSLKKNIMKALQSEQ